MGIADKNGYFYTKLNEGPLINGGEPWATQPPTCSFSPRGLHGIPCPGAKDSLRSIGSSSHPRSVLLAPDKMITGSECRSLNSSCSSPWPPSWSSAGFWPGSSWQWCSQLPTPFSQSEPSSPVSGQLTQRVALSGTTSTWREVSSSEPQGSVLAQCSSTSSSVI